MKKHHFLFDISVGEFLCTKCMAEKGSDFAMLECCGKEQKQILKKEKKEAEEIFDNAKIDCAINFGQKLEKRLWPQLKKRLDEIYKQATL